jgi:hypothetical protein
MQIIYFKYKTGALILKKSKIFYYPNLLLISLFITGGGNVYSSATLASVESIQTGNWTLDRIPNSPQPSVFLHCVTKINSTMILLTGGTTIGFTSVSYTWFYNIQYNRWFAGDEFPKNIIIININTLSIDN